MRLELVGADYFEYGYAPAGLGESLTLTTTDIGSRDMKEMLTRVQWYLDKGYAGDKAQALVWAIRDYDAAPARTGTTGGKMDWNALVQGAAKTLLDPKAWAALVAAAKGQGYTDADLARARQEAQTGGAGLGAMTPWLIVGGVGLLALVVMFGTRK